MLENKAVVETWEQIGEALGGYSGRHARRLLKTLKERGSAFPGRLKYALGKSRRRQMTLKEVDDFRHELREFEVN